MASSSDDARPAAPPSPLGLAILTVSDTRTLDTDSSGGLLAAYAASAGHRLVDRAIIPDDVPLLRQQVTAWTEQSEISVILITGGTGITGRDVTPEAIEPLLTKPIPGFGELFRMLSYADIGAATIQSRAFAGLVGSTLVFALPGSTGAVRLAIEKILAPQLDRATKPCNFVQLLPRLKERGTPMNKRTRLTLDVGGVVDVYTDVYRRLLGQIEAAQPKL
jgi:molybdopterin adenylyltransferase